MKSTWARSQDQNGALQLKIEGKPESAFYLTQDMVERLGKFVLNEVSRTLKELQDQMGAIQNSAKDTSGSRLQAVEDKTARLTTVLERIEGRLAAAEKSFDQARSSVAVGEGSSTILAAKVTVLEKRSEDARREVSVVQTTLASVCSQLAGIKVNVPFVGERTDELSNFLVQTGREISAIRELVAMTGDQMRDPVQKTESQLLATRRVIDTIQDQLDDEGPSVPAVEPKVAELEVLSQQGFSPPRAGLEMSSRGIVGKMAMLSTFTDRVVEPPSAGADDPAIEERLSATEPNITSVTNTVGSHSQKPRDQTQTKSERFGHLEKDRSLFQDIVANLEKTEEKNLAELERLRGLESRVGKAQEELTQTKRSVEGTQKDVQGVRVTVVHLATRGSEVDREITTLKQSSSSTQAKVTWIEESLNKTKKDSPPIIDSTWMSDTGPRLSDIETRTTFPSEELPQGPAFQSNHAPSLSKLVQDPPGDSSVQPPSHQPLSMEFPPVAPSSNNCHRGAPSLLSPPFEPPEVEATGLSNFGSLSVPELSPTAQKDGLSDLAGGHPPVPPPQANSSQGPILLANSISDNQAKLSCMQRDLVTTQVHLEASCTEIRNRFALLEKFVGTGLTAGQHGLANIRAQLWEIEKASVWSKETLETYCVAIQQLSALDQKIPLLEEKLSRVVDMVSRDGNRLSALELSFTTQKKQGSYLTDRQFLPRGTKPSQREEPPFLDDHLVESPADNARALLRALDRCVLAMETRGDRPSVFDSSLTGDSDAITQEQAAGLESRTSMVERNIGGLTQDMLSVQYLLQGRFAPLEQSVGTVQEELFRVRSSLKSSEQQISHLGAKLASVEARRNNYWAHS